MTVFSCYHICFKCDHNGTRTLILYSNLIYTHIPTYAAFLSINVTLLLRIATKSLSNIFYDI